MRKPPAFAFAAFIASLALTQLSSAQPSGGVGAGSPVQPAETVKPQTVSKGRTDLAKDTFATSTRVEDDDPSHAQDVSIGAGGLFSSGNARTVALTTVFRARVRREEHQFSAGAAVNFARAGKLGEQIDTTVENYQGLLRYDHFLSDEVSLFFQSTARRDRFQGLDLRLNLDPGVAYYFINTKTHRLQIEGGYDLQYDIRREQDRFPNPPAGSPPGTPPGPPVDKTQALHNARLFVGYENKLRKEVALVTNFEYLQNFADLERYRFIFDIGLKSNVTDKLAVATTYTARYENQPLPDLAELDSIASFNLVYSLF